VNIDPLIRPFLDRADVVILDGALATELERHGADLRDPLWSARVLLDAPDLIRAVHRDYFDAGADVAVTASYQASLPGLMRRGLNMGQAADVLRLSVRLAQEAREQSLRTGPPNRPRPLIAASVGCYGATLHDGSEYRGDYGLSVKQLMDWHRPRLEILATSGADLLACETIPCLAEAEALTRLLDEMPDGIPAWVSLSCCDGRHLCHGEPLAEAVALAAECGRVLAVGVNCTAPRHVADLLHSVAGITTKPLLAYPNSGEVWDAERRNWEANADVLDWAAATRSWHEAGARMIGGCCRTTPATIRNLRHAFPL
jgi:homocysteine S-methyltransferase